MTIAAPATAGALPAYDAAAFQTIIVQLQSIVSQLQQITAQLAPAGAPAAAQAGAATLGGGPTAATGCGCGGGASAVAGAETVTAGGANAAPTSAPAASMPAAVLAPTSTHAPTAATRTQSNAASKNRSRSADIAAPAGNFDLPRKNPRSVEEAMAWARGQVDNPDQSWDRLCLSFVAHAYGWSGSGVNYAIDHWDTAKESMKHPGDRNPPAGALVYWKTGSRAGHVALSMGNGMVASNDIRRQGKIDIVPMDEIDKSWGANYVGWTDPYFPNAG